MVADGDSSRGTARLLATIAGWCIVAIGGAVGAWITRGAVREILTVLACIAIASTLWVVFLDGFVMVAVAIGRRIASRQATDRQLRSRER